MQHAKHKKRIAFSHMCVRVCISVVQYIGMSFILVAEVVFDDDDIMVVLPLLLALLFVVLDLSLVRLSLFLICLFLSSSSVSSFVFSLHLVLSLGANKSKERDRFAASGRKLVPPPQSFYPLFFDMWT
jgi:hypothetical protein